MSNILYLNKIFTRIFDYEETSYYCYYSNYIRKNPLPLSDRYVEKVFLILVVIYLWNSFWLTSLINVRYYIILFSVIFLFWLLCIYAIDDLIFYCEFEIFCQDYYSECKNLIYIWMKIVKMRYFIFQFIEHSFEEIHIVLNNLWKKTWW